ncbi:MAG: hypothetical protein WDN06_15075 [Asticcacaulis sp.]
MPTVQTASSISSKAPIICNSQVTSTASLPAHVLTAAELTVGTVEAGTGAQFFFNTSNHTLYWDSNGIHSGGLTAITTLSGVTTLSAADFIFT